MKKSCIVLILTLLLSAAAHADLKVMGSGDTLAIDTTDFPPQMQKAYTVMTRRCSQCHTIERVIVAVQSGITPVSKSSFTKDGTKVLVTRMLLKAGPNYDRRERRVIVLLLNYLLDMTKVAGK
ncbi:MAG TPA: cytochrome C [Geobacteraceae bacterium]